MSRGEGHGHTFAARRLLRRLSVLAMLVFAIHALARILDGHPYDVFWACNVAVLWVAFGLLWPSRLLNSVGLQWLVIGNLLWVVELLTAGGFSWSSSLTHVGGLAAAIVGARQLGFQRGASLASVLFLWLWQQVTRWLTPAVENINLAFRVRDGWQERFPSYPFYLLMLLVSTFAVFLLVELSVQRILRGRRETGRSGPLASRKES